MKIGQIGMFSAIASAANRRRKTPTLPPPAATAAEITVLARVRRVASKIWNVVSFRRAA